MLLILCQSVRACHLLLLFYYYRLTSCIGTGRTNPASSSRLRGRIFIGSDCHVSDMEPFSTDGGVPMILCYAQPVKSKAPNAAEIKESYLVLVVML